MGTLEIDEYDDYDEEYKYSITEIIKNNKNNKQKIIDIINDENLQHNQCSIMILVLSKLNMLDLLKLAHERHETFNHITTKYNEYYKWAFLEACKCDNDEIVSWLYSLNNHDIRELFSGEWYPCWANYNIICVIGNHNSIKIGKWILSIPKDDLNVLLYSHIDPKTAQWIITISDFKLDFEYIDYIFNNLCEDQMYCGTLDFIKWLCEKYNRYEIIVDSDDKITNYKIKNLI